MRFKLSENKNWYKTHKDSGKKYLGIIKIREIILNGIKRSCPGGGFSGRKDGACTHICGEKCKKKYCYFGGKLDVDCDKSNPYGGLFRHNDNWETNEDRGPLYLKYIHKVDDRWPKDDNGCQDFLHKIIVFTELKNYADKIGKSSFENLLHKFPDIKDYGFDFSDLFTEDLTLIKR